MKQKEFKIAMTIEISAETPEKAARELVNWLSVDADMVYDVMDIDTGEIVRVDTEDNTSTKIDLKESMSLHKPIMR